jgi:peptide/nickel transport system permease protein
VLFNIKPGDPALLLGGQHSSEEVTQNIRKDLDFPFHKRYLLYLNDLSVFSIHELENDNSHMFLDNDKYSYKQLVNFSDSKTFVLKYPYLQKSYQNKRNVNDVINEKFPDTIILAFPAIF